MIVLALIASWNSNGVNLNSIIDKEPQDGVSYIVVLCVAAFSQVYVISMLTTGFAGVYIPPQIVSSNNNPNNCVV